MSADRSKTEQSIYDFIQNNSYSDISKVTSDTLLFSEGVFDSMGFVLLIDYLEEKFGIKAEDNDLTEENFESINAIVNFVLRKKEAKAASLL